MAPPPITTNTPNYSLFAIPAYLLLAIAPHLYSSTLLNAKPGTAKPKSDKPQSGNLYNMGNPRSSANTNLYSNSLSPDTYARFERARAAHNNMLENSGFVVSAILAGVVARCDAGFMNTMVGAYLTTRIAYTFSYINVGKGPLALLRTLFYFVGNGFLFAIWYSAGKKVMYGDY